jgi:hypothetical protein
MNSYLDKTFILSGLCAAKAMAGYDDVHANIKVPRH